MPEETFVIDSSKLDEAHITSDRKWLAATFDKARQVIDAGGKVNIMQRFSGSSRELVAIIDDLESFEYYRKKYN